jgi:hypothetical protein
VHPVVPRVLLISSSAQHTWTFYTSSLLSKDLARVGASRAIRPPDGQRTHLRHGHLGIRAALLYGQRSLFTCSYLRLNSFPHLVRGRHPRADCTPDEITTRAQINMPPVRPPCMNMIAERFMSKRLEDRLAMKHGRSILQARFPVPKHLHVVVKVNKSCWYLIHGISATRSQVNNR